MPPTPENQQLKSALQAVVNHYIRTDAQVGVLLCQELFTDPDCDLARALRREGIEVVQLAGYLQAQQAVNNSNSQQPSNSEIQQAAAFLDSQPCNNSATQRFNAEQQLRLLHTQRFSGLTTQQRNDLATQQLNNSATQQPDNSATQRVIADFNQALEAIQPFSNSATQQLSNSNTQQPDEPNTFYVRPNAKVTVPPTGSVLKWCAENGWLDPYWVPEQSQWWGFEGLQVMAKALPAAGQKGRFDPVATQVGTNGISGMRMSELMNRLHHFLREYERRNYGDPFTSPSCLADYFDYTFDLLRPELKVQVVNWHVQNGMHRSQLSLVFAPVYRVAVRPSAMSPANERLYMAELTLPFSELPQTLRSSYELSIFLLQHALEALQHLNLSPHPRWYVGTTDQSNRGADSDFPTTEINQCDHHFSGPQRRSWD